MGVYFIVVWGQVLQARWC